MSMSKKRVFTGIIAAMMCVAALVSCGPASAAQPTAAPEMRTVTDAVGNVLQVRADLSRIAVLPLPWSSVIYAIDGTSERMVSINPGAMTAYTGLFFSKLDSAYGKIDTSNIGLDFSVNMEEMINLGVQAMVIWDYQPDEAEQLKALGIVPVMVKNETIEDLQASFTAMGQMLGKEERAQRFNDLYTEAYQYLKSFAGEVEAASKPKVLYLRNKQLKLQGSNMFIEEALTLAGADNFAAGLSSLTMEEILKVDPDIILLSNFDPFTPDDLYTNSIEGQDWSGVSAVLNRRVYKTPVGIYRWDAPGVETPLMMKWLARLIQPDVFAEIDMRHELCAYFEELFDYSLTDEDIAQIFSERANVNSAK